jgi:hypothetical protein
VNSKSLDLIAQTTFTVAICVAAICLGLTVVFVCAYWIKSLLKMIQELDN